ncbi:MAG: SLC13/DASS family transporter [Clostridia bacterium]|nr:SLC13/DASS family transporter [Clostridia bacterium]
MTPAVISLIILAVCIVLFITRVIPNAVTACLGCLLFALTGVCTFEKAFSGFSNSTLLLMFGMMVVGIAMMDTGVARIIGRYVSKVSGGNERFFILLAGLASIILSTFLSNTAVISIFLPIISSVVQSNQKMNRKNLTLPVTMGAMFGGVCTLVGSTPQLTADGILYETTGIHLGMFDFLLPGLVVCGVYLLYVLTIGHRIGCHVWGEEVIADDSVTDSAPATQEETDAPVNKIRIAIMLSIFAFTVVMFIGGWISTAMTAVIAAILCISTKCTSWKTVVKKMDWSVVFILAGCLGIAAGLTSGGAGELMSEVLSYVLNPDINPIIIFAIFVFATMLISNFITNSTAVVIVLPIALACCSSMSLNPVTFTLGVVYAANLTFSTPLANAQTAMTLVAGYKFSDYIRYTWLLDILVYLAIVISVPLFFPL